MSAARLQDASRFRIPWLHNAHRLHSPSKSPAAKANKSLRAHRQEHTSFFSKSPQVRTRHPTRRSLRLPAQAIAMAGHCDTALLHCYVGLRRAQRGSEARTESQAAKVLWTCCPRASNSNASSAGLNAAHLQRVRHVIHTAGIRRRAANGSKLFEVPTLGESLKSRG